MFTLPFTYAARRRAIERRRRAVESRPELATTSDLVDLLRCLGFTVTEAREVVARAEADAESPAALWRRLRAEPTPVPRRAPAPWPHAS